MRNPTHQFLCGLGVGLLSQFVDKVWPDAPESLYWLLIIIAVGLIGYAIIAALFENLENRLMVPSEGVSKATLTPPPRGQLADDTLVATGVVHGGKLRLELPKGDENQRFTEIRRHGPTTTDTLILVAVWNDDYHQTVDDVTMTLVSYGPADNTSFRYPLGKELSPMSNSTSIHPRSNLLFCVGALEVVSAISGDSRRFWLGEKFNGRELEYGEYLIKVAYAGRNHSKKEEMFELRFMQLQLGIGPKVNR